MEFIFTTHGLDQFKERFSSFNPSDAFKNLTVCNNDEIYLLRNSSAYKNSAQNKKMATFFFKTDFDAYYVCEKKKQKDDSFANVVITTIDLKNVFTPNKSFINNDFKKEMIIGTFELDDYEKKQALLFSKKEKDLKDISRKTLLLNEHSYFDSYSLPENLFNYNNTKDLKLTITKILNFLTSFIEYKNIIIKLNKNIIIEQNVESYYITAVEKFKYLSMQINIITGLQNKPSFKILKIDEHTSELISDVIRFLNDNVVDQDSVSKEKLSIKISNINDIYSAGLFIDVNRFDVQNISYYISKLDNLSKIAEINYQFERVILKLNNIDKENFVYKNYLKKINSFSKEISLYLNKNTFNFEDPFIFEIKEFYKSMLTKCIKSMIFTIDKIYSKSGSLSYEFYIQCYELYQIYKNTFEYNDELIYSYLEFILPYQTKKELGCFNSDPLIFTKERINLNLSHLKDIKGFILKGQEYDKGIIEKIDNIIYFYDILLKELHLDEI